MIAGSRTISRAIYLRTAGLELGGLFAHADGQCLLGFEALFLGIFANILRDLH